MTRRRPSALKACLFLVGLVVVAVLLHALWLPVLGWALVHNDGPAKADFAVALGGDYYGLRVEEAAGLVRAGYVPHVLVSGPAILFGAYERDLAIAFAVRQGFAQEWFSPVIGHALSTHEEAYEVLAELRRRNAHSFLLVTSDYHSGRARRTFRAAAREMGYQPLMRTVVAPDRYFQVATWWRSREGRKMIYLEWSKTVAAAIGL